MRERAVRTRRKPLGASKMAFKVFHESRVTKHESRPFYRRTAERSAPISIAGSLARVAGAQWSSDPTARRPLTQSRMCGDYGTVGQLGIDSNSRLPLRTSRNRVKANVKLLGSTGNVKGLLKVSRHRDINPILGDDRRRREHRTARSSRLKRLPEFNIVVEA